MMSPIGIFDSGYGGLTILHGIRQLLPEYDYLYLGDDAGLSPEERKAKRQELARPIMEAMKLWMETEGVKYSGRNAYEAISRSADSPGGWSRNRPR